MPDTKSIIQKLVFNVSLDRTDMAFAVQNEISGLCRTSVLNALDEACMPVAVSNQYIQIAKVEIDLGRVSLSELEKELARKVKRTFSEELSARIKGMHAGEGTTAGTNALLDGNSCGPDGGGRIITQDVYDAELLRHFLSTGTLPWWAGREPLDDIEQRFESLLKKDAAGMRRLLRSVLVNRESMRRLVYQFSDGILLDIAALLAEVEPARVRGVVTGLSAAVEDARPAAVDVKRLRSFILEAAIAELLAGAVTQQGLVAAVIGSLSVSLDLQGPELSGFVEDTLMRLSRDSNVFHGDIPDIMDIITKDRLPEREYWQLRNKGIKRIDNWQYYKNEDAAAVKELEVQDSPASLDGTGSKIGHEEEYIIAGPEETTGTRPLDGHHESCTDLEGLETPRTEEAVEVQRTHIENAGLVLLWPYLRIFFENCGQFEEGAFRGEVARSRAVHLLQYISTGKERAPEYLLGLNKILCGMEITEPVYRHVSLSDFEKSEAANLLGTVISHWTSLKKTSPEGFRASFLQRDGALSRKEGGWVLQVERKSFDLLLDSLPWSISIVRSSWMKTAVYVEW